MESQKLWLRTRDVVALLGCQDCIPDSRHTLIPKTQPTEVELPLRIRSSSSIPAMVIAAVLNVSLRPGRLDESSCRGIVREERHEDSAHQG
jgi:hypothetical protein